MKLNSTIRLNNNLEIPFLGLGVFKTLPGRETQNAVKSALMAGYRHIDTASYYQNETDVGIAVKESDIPRDEIFITTKLWNDDQGYDKTRKAFSQSLKNLDTDYIDLYLIHWPQSGTRRESWQALEEIYKDGLCKAIGVSNYTIKHLNEMFDYCTVLPAVNQVEFSPFLNQKKLFDFCSCKDIAVEAYSPLTRARKLDSTELLNIGAKYSKSPAQILIRWSLQYGMIVLPKSSNAMRIRENADVFDFELDEDDMELLNSLNEDYRVAWNPEMIE